MSRPPINPRRTIEAIRCGDFNPDVPECRAVLAAYDNAKAEGVAFTTDTADIMEAIRDSLAVRR